ncbi:MAG: hypothetical protein ABI612_04505 [Betaproteobacteria bacterium]
MHKTYDYISLQDRSGKDVIARKVRVRDAVDRLIAPGAEGTFIFAKALFNQTELHVIRVGDREAYSSWLTTGLWKAYLGFGAMLVIGLALSFVYIGIPFVILCIWGMVMLPLWKAKLLQAARSEGFKLTSVQRI